MKRNCCKLLLIILLLSPMAVSGQGTPTPDEKLEQLAQRIDALEKPEITWQEVGNNLVEKSDAIAAAICWPITALGLIILFFAPIRHLLKRISLSADRIEWQGLSLTLSDINKVIIEREKLKIGVIIAMIDDDPDPSELQKLQKIAGDMVLDPSRQKSLNIGDKLQIFNSIIELATADGDFRDDEYEAILHFSKQFEVDEGEMKRLIQIACRDAVIPLPPSLIES